uniref:Glutathione hydrolase n=1 Tax=Amphiprion percula TaxID=161767 RepID=A0A3P8U6T4_AMPPE
NTAKMEVSPETKLSKQLAFSYQSFSSPQVEDSLSSNDLVKKHGERKTVNILFSHFHFGFLAPATDLIPLKQLVSGSPNLSDQHLSNDKETNEDFSSWGTPVPVYVVCIIIAAGVTFALILQIYLGESLASINGVLVSDHERCTALGQRVLQDGGSSVDAAVAGALCLGVVHPHVSGVGGGGVMLVHDIHKNQTRVINFQGTAPKTFRKEMLHNVSGLKAGLQVGVPGMLKGLQHAHSLYVFWSNIQTISFFSLKSIILPENDKPGFHLSSSIADAISKVEGEQLSQRFRDIFIPEGRALQAGSYVRIPGLAGVLEAGLSNFYYGNLSQEIEDEVRANGGVLSRDDISNYSVESVTFVLDYIIQVPPPPSAGAVLISALNILSENNITENQTHPWIAEAMKAALFMTYGLGDPKYNSSVMDKNQTEMLLQRMNHSHTPPSDSGQVVVMGPDDLVVSVASSLNRPFGSRIITRSGIILNSLLLDYLWSNKTQRHADSEERPLLLLMPTIMMPAWRKCGIYTALSSSAASPEESVQFIHAEGHVVQRGKTNSAVQGIQRRENIIKVIKV